MTTERQKIKQVYSRISSFTSGKSSKLLVSSIDLTWTAIAAGLSLICSQSTFPLKKGAVLISSIPRPAPSRRSASQQNLTPTKIIIISEISGWCVAVYWNTKEVGSNRSHSCPSQRLEDEVVPVDHGRESLHTLFLKLLINNIERPNKGSVTKIVLWQRLFKVLCW